VARSPRAAGAIGSDDYTGFSLILICVGLGILGWAGWKLWHAQISTVALVVAHREMQAIAFFSERFSQADVGVQRADPPWSSSRISCGSTAISELNSCIRRWLWFWRLARSLSCVQETLGSHGLSISTR
jgi:hypothetical protein